MRIKTFIATYLLFLFILFSSVAMVSIYLTNSQINMLRDKSTAQYQSIIHTLARDIAISSGRTGWVIHEMVREYARYFNRHNVDLYIIDTMLPEFNHMKTEINLINDGKGHTISITGFLPEPFAHFALVYLLDITNNIVEMQNIQRVLMVSAGVFSLVAAVALYLILSGIFKPLEIVSKAAGKIANGKYDERIYVKGRNELAKVARDFNRMAEKIERQISFLEEEAENKQQFVDNFTHEIRTPLTSIYGYAEYMQKALLDEAEIIESANFIMGEARHMKNIADALLELATLRNFIPNKKEILIDNLLNNITQTLEQPLRKTGVKIKNHTNVPTMFGQEDLIRSLILNLCTNAIKACKSGEGIIWLEADGDDTHTVIIVADNGCGVPPKSLTKLTEPFYRVDEARNRDHGGTGLGLTLCKQIAEVHGAKMEITSVEEKGTTIKIKFTNQ
jgi:signal transduction histidine kinase